MDISAILCGIIQVKHDPGIVIVIGKSVFMETAVVGCGQLCLTVCIIQKDRVIAWFSFFCLF